MNNLTLDELYRVPVDAAYRVSWPYRWRWMGHRKKWERDGLEVDELCPECGDKIADYHREYEPWPNATCRCELDAHTKAYDAAFETVRDQVARRLWWSAGIPPRYLDASFVTFEDRDGAEAGKARCLAWAEKYNADTSRGLFLCGPFGSGKTHLAVSTLRTAVGRTCVAGKFTSAAALLHEIKGGDKFNHEPLQRACGSKLLLLDDLGQVGRTEFDRETAYTIVSERYENLRPTIVTSNLPPDKLGEMLGGALASRIYEACEIVVLTASDFRKERRGL